MTSPIDIRLPLSFESAHLSFSELWLALTHSSLGGAGGKGRVDNLADGPKGPMPRALIACKSQFKLAYNTHCNNGSMLSIERNRIHNLVILLLVYLLPECGYCTPCLVSNQ